MLLLALALIGMHQLVAAAHGAGHASASPAVSTMDADHVHGADAHETCHHETAGGQPECAPMGDTCVAVLDDSWVDAEPPSGLPGPARECDTSNLTAGGAREVREPPDQAWLSVWRT
jgi:uncharacterized membrane protein